MSKKGIFGVVVIGAALVYGLVSVVVQMNEKREVPTPDEARYSVTTASRVYYTSNAERVSDNLTILHGYWWLGNKVWRYDKGDLTLTPKYGKVRVIDRRTK